MSDYVRKEDVIIFSWKIQNPYSFLERFDAWFEFEKEKAFTKDGFLPDRIIRRLIATCGAW